MPTRLPPPSAVATLTEPIDDAGAAAPGALGWQAPIRLRHGVRDGATVEWLPQETIAFDGCQADAQTSDRRALPARTRDPAPLVSASLEVMERDARKMRGERPFVLTDLKAGRGLDRICEFIASEGMLRAV